MAWRKSKQGRDKPNPCKIFVGNISYRIKEKELSDFFSHFGPVTFSQIIKDHRKGWSRGIGFVTFNTVEAAQSALEAEEEALILDGRVMRVSKPQSKKRLKALQDSLKTSNGGEDSSDQDGGKPDQSNGEDSSDEDGGKPGQSPSNTCGSSKEIDVRPSETRLPELNDDILLHLFSYLGLKDKIMIERVCRRWYRVARLSWPLMRTLSFRNVFASFKGKYGGLSDDILHSILKRGCRDLEFLDLSCSPVFLTDYALDLIGMYCNKLIKLDLSGVSVTQTSFKLLSERCSGLKWLRMSGCNHAGEKCLWWAVHNCTHLEYLNVASNRRINGQFFYVSGSKLKSVILKDCDKLTDQGLSFLLKQNPNLELLDIDHCPLLTGTTIRSVTQHSSQLKELYFAGPNQNVKTSDVITLAKLVNLEVLVVNHQLSFGDEVLSAIGRNCYNLRKLSCEACYNVSDAGVQCLTTCTQLSNLTISYCHQVTDLGLMNLARFGLLELLVARACQAITDRGLCFLAEKCTQLIELDICGCMSVTNRTVYALQESILHMREHGNKQFALLAGGTGIDGEVATQFAIATGAILSLHDLSVHTLSADYDPFMEIPPLTEECWEDDDEPHTEVIPGSLLEAETGYSGRLGSDFLMDKAEDFLIADDPALYSDEFSDPEEWGLPS